MIYQRERRNESAFSRNMFLSIHVSVAGCARAVSQIGTGADESGMHLAVERGWLRLFPNWEHTKALLQSGFFPREPLLKFPTCIQIG